MGGFLKTESVYLQNLSPYFNLWAAVLDQAVFDLQTPIPRSEVRQWAMNRQDALEWVESDAEYFNSFVHVCRILGLDPANTRKSILSGKREYVRRYRPKKTCVWCGKSYTKSIGKAENGNYVCNECKRRVK